MFCNFCGAPNPDVASFCNKCGKPIARAAAPAAAASAEAQPISYVMDVTPPAAASPIASAAMAALPASSVSPAALVGAPVIGALSPAARAQFTDGLVVEVNRQIGDKCIPAAI